MTQPPRVPGRGGPARRPGPHRTARPRRHRHARRPRPASTERPGAVPPPGSSGPRRDTAGPPTAHRRPRPAGHASAPAPGRVRAGPPRPAPRAAPPHRSRTGSPAGPPCSGWCSARCCWPTPTRCGSISSSRTGSPRWRPARPPSRQRIGQLHGRVGEVGGPDVRGVPGPGDAADGARPATRSTSCRGAAPTAPATADPDAGRARDTGPWYGQLWSSVQAADKPRRAAVTGGAPRRPPRISRSWRSSSAAPRGVPARWRTAARAACRTRCEVAPRLPDGTPFPTLYYLTCPRAVSACSRLESAGLMREMNARLADGPRARRRVPAGPRGRTSPSARRSGRYRRSRACRPAGCRPGSSACMSTSDTRWRSGPGVNPFGDEVRAIVEPWWTDGPCVP